MLPEIAIAASAREWPDRLHRHLLDHGGARVVGRVMSSDEALALGFHVLLIDDICSFLTPRLVTLTRQRGAGVLGTFDSADGPDAKRNLLECGVTDVIESDATPEEFIQAVRRAMDRPFDSTHTTAPSGSGAAYTIGVAGVTRGVGSTEVAVALAYSLSGGLETTLVDLDPHWPSVAPRLDLPLHPNLRTAVDRIARESQDLASAIHRIGDLRVVGGLADRGAAGPLSQGELLMLLDSIGQVGNVVVVDLGPLGDVHQVVMSRFDIVVLVTSGDPVGLSRLHSLEKLVSPIDDDERLVIVVNQTPASRYHEAEIRSELASAWSGTPVIVLPFDSGVADAMWQGSIVRRGKFSRGVGRMSNVIRESVRG